MSGSYDRPGGPRRPYPPQQRPPEVDLYEEPTTGPPAHYGAGDYTAPEPVTQRDLYAARQQEAEFEPSHGPIVPAGSVTGQSLTLVISIMCFLACLTAGAVYIVNQSAAAWLKEVASEVTVQVEPREKVDTEATVTNVVQFLQRQPGVVGAHPLSTADEAALLEPWLGQSDSLKNLPIPRLISVELDRGAPPELGALRKAVETTFQKVNLDDHRHWQQQIRAVTRSLALGGLAILLLVGAATTAIIISATRSAMASNREIVEVLHFVGATDRFIAREFEGHFLRLGIRAGVVGAGVAMGVFAAIPLITETMGGGSMTVEEMRHLVGTGTLDLQGYMLLGAVVIVIAALCMLTSRFGVFRILHSQQ